jgi:hypothetical protein
MRPVSVSAKGPAGEIEQLQAALRSRWRQTARAVMVLLSAHGYRLPRSRSCRAVTRPRCAAGSAGSTMKGWRTGRGPGGQRWAGAG